jgi:hypothetical protein
MSDKRRDLRRRTFKGGAISWVGGGTDCIIRNLSDTGALLECPNPAALPENFVLTIKPELLKRSCGVAWRCGQRVGAHFKDNVA